MTAVVFGGSGFLGSHICEELLRRGQEVVAVDDLSSGRMLNIEHLLSNSAFRFIECDISKKLPDLGTPTQIFNFASPASPPRYLSIPVHTLRTGSLGTLNALDLANNSHCRLIMASTSEIYGDPLEHPQKETYWGNVNPIGERSCYDESKRFSEALCMGYHRQFGTDVGIVRIFNTYGPRMSPSDGRVVSNFISAALGNKPLEIFGTGLQTRSLCFVSDLVEGIVKMSDSNATGPVNLGNPFELTVLDLAKIIIKITDSKSEIVFKAQMQDDPMQRKPDIDRAKNLLDWTPDISLEIGLEKTINWIKGLNNA